MAFWNKSKQQTHGDATSHSKEDKAERALKVVRAYHEATKHHFHRPAHGPMGMDWAIQPDAFRSYGGADCFELERVWPTDEPDYARALVAGEIEPVALNRSSISQLLFDSLSISAWKEAGESRWAVRVNPSSGNLHPTEAYLLLPAIAGLGERAAVHHYAPLEHQLERRAEIPGELWRSLFAGDETDGFAVVLTSIHWREAWKYGERAFRYCQHDVGHAIAALSVACAGLGWRLELDDSFTSDDLRRMLGLSADPNPELEAADCFLRVSSTGSIEKAPVGEDVVARFDGLDWRGSPNDLSDDHEDWDAVDMAHEASQKVERGIPYGAWNRPGVAVPAVRPARSLRRVIRQRRSGISFDGKTGMPAETFFSVLESCMPREGRYPFNALPWSARIHLALFVHRVEGLTPGLYWLARDGSEAQKWREVLRPEFLWQAAEGAPQNLPLQLLLPMDLKAQAAQVSCGQDIAGDGCFSLGMLADYDHSLKEFGASFYPRLFWEAGVVGQALYLDSEAVGLRSTGIGCYFDDAVHSMLGLRDRKLQSLYHFTVGGAVEDTRLRSSAAYGEAEA